MLTDAEEEAKRLGLTQQEARFSLAIRTPPARWTGIKAQIITEEAVVSHEHEEQFNAAMIKR